MASVSGKGLPATNSSLSAWKLEPTPERVESLERVVVEIQQLNPTFKFELPKR